MMFTSGIKTKMGGSNAAGRHYGQFLVGSGIEILSVKKDVVRTLCSTLFA
jgi:hypothetical protein